MSHSGTHKVVAFYNRVVGSLGVSPTTSVLLLGILLSDERFRLWG